MIAAPAIAQGPVVRAPAGAIEGEAKGDVLVFKGVPYALPPVGAARWKPPVAMPAWNGVRDATRFGSGLRSAQAAARQHLCERACGEMSEDCLFLNVWTQEEARNAPVFVWIHGGALTTGCEQRADVRRHQARRARRGRRVDQLSARASSAISRIRC